ncbi:MAG: hypothetical protein Q8L86_19000 [Vicinamibacterales bacterium]|nr:hypothetical protein [Vicinamibacterales bacterium]
MDARRKPADAGLDQHDDCFALFDAVFSALATELSWEDTPEAPVEETPDALRLALAADPVGVAPAPAVVTAPEAAVAPSGFITDEALDALDTLRPPGLDEAIQEARAPGFDRFDAAFDQIDASISASVTAVPARVSAAGRPTANADAHWFDDDVFERLDGAMRSVPARGTPLALAPAGGIAPATVREAQMLGSGGRLDRALAVLEGLWDVRERIDGDVTPALRQDAARRLDDARRLCTDLGLQTAGVRAAFAIAALEHAHQATLRTEIDELARHIRHDLRTWSIWPVSASRAWMLGLTCSPAVQAAFPSAQPDVTEAGLCLGLARHAAAVFHLVRAGQRGVRALAVAADAGAAQAAGHDRLDPLIAIIESRVGEVDAWPEGAVRTQALMFLRPGLDEARSLREWARRLSPEAGGALEERDVLAALQCTTRLLDHLAERVSERQDRTLGKRDFTRAARPARTGSTSGADAR